MSTKRVIWAKLQHRCGRERDAGKRRARERESEGSVEMGDRHKEIAPAHPIFWPSKVMYCSIFTLATCTEHREEADALAACTAVSSDGLQSVASDDSDGDASCLGFDDGREGFR